MEARLRCSYIVRQTDARVRGNSLPRLRTLRCLPGRHLRRPLMPKRELIDTGTDKRYVRRDPKGRFKESDDVGKSLSQDVRKPAKTKVKPGQGDKGDQKH